MQTISALLICGVDYKSARNMDYREAEILVDEWVFMKGGKNEEDIYVVE